MSALEDLLQVQEHDRAADRLRHRRATLPERGALEICQAKLAEISAQLIVIRGQRDEVLGEERRLDDEASTLEAKAKAVEDRLYSGTVASPKELQAMQADVDQLRRHRSRVEDAELEVIERREVLDASVTDLENALADLQTEGEQLTRAIMGEEAMIDETIEKEEALRDAMASGVADDITELYRTTRLQSKNGVGIARLVGLSCDGCHLTLSSIEVDRMRHEPVGTIERCEHCGCLLVVS